MDAPIADPYRHCDVACNHDLSRGVTIADLFDGDGPYPTGNLLVNLSTHRAVLLDDEHREIEGQQVLTTREAV
jgi:hypothetical protein